MSILKEDLNIPRLIRFQSDVSTIEIPEKFTFPFYYSPSEIAKVAVEELKLYIHNQQDWSHRFAKSESKERHWMRSLRALSLSSPLAQIWSRAPTCPWQAQQREVSG